MWRACSITWANRISTYFEKFWDKYRAVNEKNGREQYLVPYLMSSHPGCTLEDAVELAEFLHAAGHRPEQVQDFYPTPGTLSTCMYYTGIDPRDMSPVFAETTPHGKELQRALLQWFRPELRDLVIEALRKAGREDLIGFGPKCLVRPYGGKSAPRQSGKPAPKRAGAAKEGRASEKPSAARGGRAQERSGIAGKPKRLVRKAGWAKPKAKTGAGKRKKEKHS